MGTDHEYVSSLATKYRNRMILYIVLTIALLVLIFATRWLPLAVPLLITCVMEKVYEEAWQHYKSLGEGLAYEAEMERT